MAKLNARGRTVRAEAAREYTAEQLQAAHDRYKASYTPDYVAGSDRALTTWERKTHRLMSDGKVLEKVDVRFQPDWSDKNGRRYSYGWKVIATLKAGKTAQDWIRMMQSPRKSGKPSPWTVTTSCAHLPAAKVISQKRIMAALESGDMIGFCTACGSEQLGVEPDANGYKCEGCGELAVSGAENLLLETAS